MHVAREARDDDTTGRLRDNSLENRTDVTLVGREPRNVGIRGVGKEEVDAGLAQARERTEIGDAIVERQLVHLEVTRVEHDTCRCRDRDGESIRDRVVDRDKLELEWAELLVLAFLHRQRVRRDAVLLELRFDEREGQRRSDERDVLAQLEQVGHGTNVVFMAVGEHDAKNVV